MLMYKLMVLCIIGAANGLSGDEDGFDDRCLSNNTLFVQRGDPVKFQFDITALRNGLFSFHVYKGVRQFEYTLFDGIIRDSDMRTTIMEDRVNYTLNSDALVVTLDNVDVHDSGMYMCRSYFRYRVFHCYELFVTDIWSSEADDLFEEHHPAYIYASPPASRIVRPRVNATTKWMLENADVKQYPEILEQDGRLVIIRMPRNFDGKIVTYRIQPDNGTIHDVNLTIEVAYGPDSPLTLNPDKSFYTLTSGNVLPDITCSTDCNPPCQITWDKFGVGNTLHLGHLVASSSGLYTCRAIRNTSTSEHVVEKIIYLRVEEKISFVIIASALGAIQGLTLIGFGIYAVCVYRSSTKAETGEKKEKTKSQAPQNKPEYQNDQSASAVEIEQYEDLDQPQATEMATYEYVQ